MIKILLLIHLLFLYINIYSLEQQLRLKFMCNNLTLDSQCDHLLGIDTYFIDFTKRSIQIDIDFILLFIIY